MSSRNKALGLLDTSIGTFVNHIPPKIPAQESTPHK
jgi:hypothetical protein